MSDEASKYNSYIGYNLTPKRPGTTDSVAGFRRVPTLTTPNWYNASAGTHNRNTEDEITDESQLTSENGFVTPAEFYAKLNDKSDRSKTAYRDDRVLTYQSQYWWCEDLHNWCIYKATVHDGDNIFNEIMLYVWNGIDDWISVGDCRNFYNDNCKSTGKFAKFQAKYLNSLFYSNQNSIRHTRGYIGHDGYNFTDGPLSVNLGIILNKQDKYSINCSSDFMAMRYENEKDSTLSPCHIPSITDAIEFDQKTYREQTTISDLSIIIGLRDTFVRNNMTGTDDIELFTEWINDGAKMFLHASVENKLDTSFSTWHIPFSKLSDKSLGAEDRFWLKKQAQGGNDPMVYYDNKTDYFANENKDGSHRPIDLNKQYNTVDGGDTKDNLYFYEVAMEKIFELKIYNTKTNQYISVPTSGVCNVDNASSSLYASWIDIMMIFGNLSYWIGSNSSILGDTYYYDVDEDYDEGGPWSWEDWWDSNWGFITRFLIAVYGEALNQPIPGLDSLYNISDKTTYDNWMLKKQQSIINNGAFLGDTTNYSRIIPIFLADPSAPQKRYKIMGLIPWYYRGHKYADKIIDNYFTDVTIEFDDDGKEIIDSENAGATLNTYLDTFVSFIKTLRSKKLTTISEYSTVLTTNDINQGDGANGNPFLIPLADKLEAEATTLETSNIREGIPLANPAIRRTPGGQVVLSTLLAWGGMHRFMGGEDDITDEAIVKGGDDKATEYINSVTKIWFGDGNDKTIDKHWLKEYADKKDDEQSTDGSIVVNSRLDSGYTYEQINKNEDNDMVLNITTYRPKIVTTTSGENVDTAKKW